jgi:Fic family protein
MSPDAIRRHSKALEAELISDPEERARAEARNGLRQFDLGIKIVEDALAKGPLYKLRPSALLALHRTALEGINAFAGNFRPAGIEIQGSKHTPPGAYLVPELVEDMCDYVNSNWSTSTPVHLAAYVMWRLNWIHPFVDGNGRTSRVLSYVVLSARLGFRLPGTMTIPEQIERDRNPYFHALDEADEACKRGLLDVSAMEAVIESLLAKQLTNIYEMASGKSAQPQEL